MFNLFIKLLICLVLSTCTHGLNTQTYDRVLSMVALMEPTPQPNLDIIGAPMKRNEKCIIVYMDKTCSDENGGVQHLVDELMSDISDCFAFNDINPNINNGYGDDNFIFIDRKSKACAKQTMVDMNAFCISMVEYEPIPILYDISVQPRPTPWNLERLDISNDFGSDFGYTYRHDYHYNTQQHNNLNVYIVDHTVRFSHEQFDDIITKVYLGPITGDFAPGDHGTHVAGTVVGNTVGLIRDTSVGLYSYGVCITGSNHCKTAKIINALQAIITHVQDTGTRGVINFSIGYPSVTTVLDGYIAQLRSLGVIFVAAAGNDNANACNYSPSHSSDAMTVGSYTISNVRSSFSNYGPCIDAWGPGTNIYSSVASSDVSYSTRGGTSMSSPAIAGTIGLLLLENNDLTFDEIKSILFTQNYGFEIASTTGYGVARNQFGFGVPIGDYNYVANNPGASKALSKANDITRGESVSNRGNLFDLDGQEHFYRVIIDSTADVTFSKTSGTITSLSFYDINYELIQSTTGDILSLMSIGSDAYWLGVSGSIGGQYTVQMIILADAACVGIGKGGCRKKVCCPGGVCDGRKCVPAPIANEVNINSINTDNNNINVIPQTVQIQPNTNPSFSESSDDDDDDAFLAELDENIEDNMNSNDKHSKHYTYTIDASMPMIFGLFVVVCVANVVCYCCWFYSNGQNKKIRLDSISTVTN